MKWRSARILILLLAASCSSAFAIIGPLRPSWPLVPWTPKWGARVSFVCMLGTAIAAGILAPKKRKREEGRDRARSLMYMISEYNDPWAEDAYSKEYEKRESAARKYQGWYWAMTGSAIFFGLLAGCEFFNQWYWKPLRWRKKLACRRGQPYTIGDAAMRYYLRALHINHESVSCAKKSRRGVFQYYERLVRNLPKIREDITKESDINRKDVRHLLSFVGWKTEGFNAHEPTREFRQRVVSYFESLCAPLNLRFIAHIERQLIQRMKLSTEQPQILGRNSRGQITAVAL